MTPTESGQPPGRPAPPAMPGRSFSPLWFAAGLLLLMVLANVVRAVVGQGEELQYSQFKSLLGEGRVSEVVISAGPIDGTYQNAAKAMVPFYTVPVEDPKLLELLESKNVQYKAKVDSRWLTELLSWVLPVLLIVGLWLFFFRRMSGAEGGIMSFGRSRAKIFSEDDVKVSFADVAGVDEAAEELREIVEFLKNAEEVHDARRPHSEGRAARRPARHRQDAAGPRGRRRSQGALLQPERIGLRRDVRRRRRGARARSVPAGRGEGAVHRLHRRTRRARQGPHAVADGRPRRARADAESAAGRDGRLRRRRRASSSWPRRTGPRCSTRRSCGPGRFDRQVLVDKPDVKGREAILRIHVRTVKLGADVDLAVIAARTAGLAGADLANLVNEAALLAARRDKAAVGAADFDEAIDRVVAGLEKKRVMNPRVRRIVAVHESGHAIVATVLPGGDPVHKVSIVQRGFGALGYTMQLPLEDRYLLTRTELENQLAVLLGGRTAELLEFGEFSTGAQNDLLRATDIARAMVTEFGMSEAIGPVNHEGRRRSTFVETPFMPERGAYAEETARVIDAEVKRIVIRGRSLGAPNPRGAARPPAEADRSAAASRKSSTAISCANCSAPRQKPRPRRSRQPAPIRRSEASGRDGRTLNRGRPQAVRAISILAVGTIRPGSVDG